MYADAIRLVPKRPGLCAFYGDERAWAGCKPDGIDLDALETTVVRQLHPPPNLDKVGERRTELREARRRMADIARTWKPRGETPTRAGGELPAE